jgi:hypothetical protein
VHVPQRPVEAVIALSIVFVAAEILRMRRGIKSITIIRTMDSGAIIRAELCGGLSELDYRFHTSDGTAVIQPGCRVRPFFVHRRRPVVDRARGSDSHSVTA